MVSHPSQKRNKKKKKNIVRGLAKAKASSYYIYVCEHGCTVEREKNKRREEKGEERGEEAEKKKREGARLAQ